MRQFMSISVCLLVAGCATAPTERSARPVCDVRSNCFNERSVRSFEMLDNDTMLVEVGGARCPYLVEVDGIFCDLGFTSMIVFQDTDGRICAADRTFVIGGPFARDPEDACRVRNVRAISEDELLERYADLGRIPPLPPTGSGELQVEDDTPPTPEGGTGSNQPVENGGVP